RKATPPAGFVPRKAAPPADFMARKAAPPAGFVPRKAAGRGAPGGGGERGWGRRSRRGRMGAMTHVLAPAALSASPPLLAEPPAPFGDVVRSDAAFRTFLHGLPGVDQVGAEARAAQLGTRSIKTTAKAWAIDTAISMVDLTTLEGADTPGKVRSLCAKARRPDPGVADVPSVAAVCVYPDLVATAVEALRGSSVVVASVATAFPSGRAALAT